MVLTQVPQRFSGLPIDTFFFLLILAFNSATSPFKELDGRVPRAKERTIMFDSTDTLSAVSGDNSVKEAAVETPAPTFYIGDTPIVRGKCLPN